MRVFHLRHNGKKGTCAGIRKNERRHGRDGLGKAWVAKESVVRLPMDILGSVWGLILEAHSDGHG